MAKGQRTHYDVLGLPREATTQEIKQQANRLMRQHHSDVQQDGSVDEFNAVLMAKDILGDPQKRAEYDRELDRLDSFNRYLEALATQAAAQRHRDEELRQQAALAQLMAQLFPADVWDDDLTRHEELSVPRQLWAKGFSTTSADGFLLEFRPHSEPVAYFARLGYLSADRTRRGPLAIHLTVTEPEQSDDLRLQSTHEVRVSRGDWLEGWEVTTQTGLFRIGPREQQQFVRFPGRGWLSADYTRVGRTVLHVHLDPRPRNTKRRSLQHTRSISVTRDQLTRGFHLRDIDGTDLPIAPRRSGGSVYFDRRGDLSRNGKEVGRLEVSISVARTRLGWLPRSGEVLVQVLGTLAGAALIALVVLYWLSHR